MKPRSTPFALLAVGAVAFHLAAASAETFDTENYPQARQRLLQEDRKRSFSRQIRLSSTEQRANEYLLQLKRLEIQRTAGQFPPSKNFLRVKPVIDRSPLLDVFRRLPKGGVLHAHPGALGDFKELIAYGTYLPNCYLYTGTTNGDTVTGSLAFFKTAPSADWKLVSELRRAASDPRRFDEQLLQSLTLGVEDLSAPDIWLEFENCWSRIGRFASYLPVFQWLTQHELDRMAAENVDVLELRSFLGGVYDLDGRTYTIADELRMYRQFLERTRQKHPDFRLKLIYSWARRDEPANVEKHLRTALDLRKSDPDLVVGFDLVNEEDRSHNLIDFLPAFKAIDREERTSGVRLPYFFHAGESNWTENENLFDALLLNSRRIGHGLALAKHPALMERVRQKQIAVEVCPISNQVLGYVADLRIHPAISLLKQGVPVALSPDDPGMMGYTFSYDFYAAFTAWGLDLADLKQLALNSLEYSTLDKDEKRQALQAWRARWDRFIEWLNTRPVSDTAFVPENTTSVPRPNRERVAAEG